MGFKSGFKGLKVSVVNVRPLDIGQVSLHNLLQFKVSYEQMNY